MKPLLTTTAIIEGATGIALVMAPSMVANSLLGTAMIDPSAILIAKLAGSALITIALACWLSRNVQESKVMVKAMLTYNVLATSILVYAALIPKLNGLGLWPAILLHLVLFIWCISSLVKLENISADPK